LLVTPEACPRRKHLKGPPIGFGLALPSNSKTQLERVSKANPLAYRASTLVMKEKRFITLTPGFLAGLEHAHKVKVKTFYSWEPQWSNFQLIEHLITWTKLSDLSFFWQIVQILRVP